MKLFRQSARRRISGFMQAEDGAVTIELVLWLPIFALLLGLIADTSLMFGGQAEALRIVQDANRSLSVGRIMSIEDAEAYVLEGVAPISPNATIDITIQHGVISSTLMMPASDITATGMFSGFDSLNLRITAQHMSEA